MTRDESRRAITVLLTLALLFGIAAFLCLPAHAQSFSVVHSFTGGDDGGNPLNGLVADSGALYGTTSAGGASGAGVVYKISPTTGEHGVVYTFRGGADGASPESALIVYSGNLYGTTAAGGVHGSGTVFEVTPAGKETVLYSFTGKADGSGPKATLTTDSSGNLYGTTFSGGAHSNGTVFELVKPTKVGESWTEHVLYSFGTRPDGANPVAGVTFDNGDLYGTTSAGGTYSYGTIFELSPSRSGWTETILHEFELQSDGGVPYAGLTVASSSKLYGAATDGGQGSANGGGTVFELNKSSSGWTFAVIKSLAGWGISGTYRNVLLSDAKIYATTHCDGAHNAGTIYELTPSDGSWDYTALYTFTGGSDGLYSFSNLVLVDGYLWGTTNVGGSQGAGVVFKTKP
jgi:uncharacterized repeat protein (TIGR03803 family)